MSKPTYKEANRRYRRVFIPTMVVYCAVAFGGPLALDALFDAPPIWALAVVALVSALPIWLAFFWMWRLVRETDEFTREKQMSSMALGGMITAGIAALWGFLEIFHVMPKYGVFMLSPLFFLTYGLSYAFVFRGGCEPGIDR